MTGRGPIHNVLPQGLYERLIYSDEAARIDGLIVANQAIVSEPSTAQRREHLIDELASRLPELLDNVTSAEEGHPSP